MNCVVSLRTEYQERERKKVECSPEEKKPDMGYSTHGGHESQSLAALISSALLLECMYYSMVISYTTGDL